jgi:hypothetical protein
MPRSAARCLAAFSAGAGAPIASIPFVKAAIEEAVSFPAQVIVISQCIERNEIDGCAREGEVFANFC